MSEGDRFLGMNPEQINKQRFREAHGFTGTDAEVAEFIEQQDRPRQMMAMGTARRDPRTERAEEALAAARYRVKEGSTWRHYKGETYKVVGHVIDADEETDEPVVKVRYQKLNAYGHGMDFTRKVDIWLGVVPIQNPDNGDLRRVSRYEPVREVKRYETSDERRLRG